MTKTTASSSQYCVGVFNPSLKECNLGCAEEQAVTNAATVVKEKCVMNSVDNQGQNHER